MMGLKWHRLNHIQTICNLLQTDNHAQHSSLILMGQMSSLRQTNGVQTLKTTVYFLIHSSTDYYKVRRTGLHDHQPNRMEHIAI